MRLFSWKKRRADRQLSEYLDGGLDEEENIEIGERLVFDDDFMNRHDELARATSLADAALAPTMTPSTEAFADHLAALMSGQSGSTIDGPLPAASTTPPASRRHLTPAILASIGLLITASLTFAGLRRRGLV